MYKLAVSYSHSSHPDSSLHLSLRVWKKVIKGRNPILHACRPFLLPAFLPAFQRTVVKFTRDEVKQFPFTTTRLPRYSFVCYFLFPFLFTSSSLPFLFLFFTAEVAPYLISLSTPPPLSVSSLFRQTLPVFSFFFFPLFFFLFLFTTAAFVQSVNTSNEAFVAFFSPRVFFASLSTRPLLSQLPLLRRVCRRPPHRRVR